MRRKIDREIAVSIWVRSALKDLFYGFFLDEVFIWDTAFYYSQGLEKLCKAYIIGAKASEYENLNGRQARVKINEIAKSYSHSLKKMIKELLKKKVLKEEDIKKVYAHYGRHQITGNKLVSILERAYEESRYPVPHPVHEDYPIEGGGWHAPLECSELSEFSYVIGLKIINKIEQDFAIKIKRDKPLDTIKNEDWIRFRRIFFKEI